MNRRGFLTSILALGAAPAIVRADSLMRIVPMDVDVFGYRGWTERGGWSYDDYGQFFEIPRSAIDDYYKMTPEGSVFSFRRILSA